MKKTFFGLKICMWYLLVANTTFAFTRQDSLRGGNGSGRNWWDVQKYELSVDFNPEAKNIMGENTITFLVTGQPNDSLQIDLQDTLSIDKVIWNDQSLPFAKEGNAWWITIPSKQFQTQTIQKISVQYHGRPRVAKLPPWDGGFIWTKDSMGNDWFAVACQGLGASSWWPCKDYQADEPDSGMIIRFDIEDKLVVSNGKIQANPLNRFAAKNRRYFWEVKNPINTYDATFYVGEYATWYDTLMGEKGQLDLGFYALRHNQAKAKKHFAVTKQMLRCFEYWMGPYPFYEDGYKLVEAPYLGMEHQSAVAYGNQYKMGYRGMDRSGTGVGLLFDFIIVHESGHEWFGNNITASDIADNWIHEGFTTYTEALFVECAFGKEKAFEYTRGQWKNIENDKPVIGTYGVHDDGSGDKYDKGSAVVHMIRMMINDDEKFRQLLRGLNKTYYHKIVSSAEIEQFIMKLTGLQLKSFFDQYLRTSSIPEIEWYIKNDELFYRFTNTVDGFTLPLEVFGDKTKAKIRPTHDWQSIRWKNGGYNVMFSKDFLIKSKP